MKKFYTSITIALVSLASILLLPAISNAQKNDGTDFWFTMPKDNPLVAAPAANVQPYKIVAIGYYDCIITVDYPGRAGTPGARQVINYTGGQRTIIQLPNTFVDPLSNTERLYKNGIHITSTLPIALYAVHFQESSNEVGPIFPSTKLGKFYITSAYREDSGGDNFNARINIGAVENNTTITIKLPPNAWTSLYNEAGFAPLPGFTHNPNDSWTITLNKGDTYTFLCNNAGLAQTAAAPIPYAKHNVTNVPRWFYGPGLDANVIGNNLGLNNVQITSDKDIYVLGGTDCTWIGVYEYPYAPGCGACDITFSQLLPVSKWGKTFATAQTLSRKQNLASNNNPAQLVPTESSIGDYLWITASEDNTQITIKGKNIPAATPATKTLQKGEFWMWETAPAGSANGNVTNPGYVDHVVTATKPVSVLQLQKGWQCDGVGADPSANQKDPSALWVFSEDFWRGTYILTNPTDLAGGIAYQLNYFIILTNKAVTPEANISLTVNNANFPIVTAWTPIANTTYSYNRIDLGIPAGASIKVRSVNETPFAFYASGAGGAGSYGYMGGATCDMQAFGGADTVNVCNSDSTHFRLDSVRNGVVTKPAVHPTYANPIYRWHIDLDNDGIYNVTGGAADPGDPADLTGPTPRFLFTIADTYNIILELTDVAGCFDRDTFQITTISDIEKPTIVGPNALCEGDSIQLTAIHPLTTGRFTWTNPYLPATTARTFGKDNSILKGKPTSPAMPYLVKYVTPTCASADTFFNVVFLLNLPAPLVTGDREICDGESTTLQVISGNGFYEMYLDSTDANPIDTNSTGEFIFSGLPIGTNYRYFKYTSPSRCETYFAKDSIVVYPFPVAPSINSNSPICQGDRDTLTASGSGVGATYHWFAANAGGSSLRNASTYITPILNTTTTYYAEARANGCASPRSPHTVDVTPTPLQPTVSNDTICAGNTGRLNVTNIEPNAQLTWYSIASTESQFIIKPRSLETFYNTPLFPRDTLVSYYVQSTVGKCESEISSGEVTVTKLPIITRVTPTATCSNQPNLSLDVFPGNDDINDIKYSYEYFDANKQPLPGGGSPSDPNFSSTYDVTPGPNSNSTYYIVLTELATACPSDTFEHKVTVNPSPIVNSFTLPVCVGNTASLVPSPDSSSAYNYFWYKNLTGGGAAVSQAVPFNIPNIQRDTVFYLLARHKTNLCQNNPRVKITVDAIDIPVITNVTGNVVCEGRDANLVATSSSDPNVTYNWYENDLPGVGPEPNSNPNSSRFRVDKSRVADGKKFYVEAVENSQAACKSPRRAIPLTVVPATLEPVAIGCYDTLYADKLTVEWAAVQGAGSYELSRDNFTTTVNVQAVFGQSDYQYTFNNLAYGQSYSISIRATPPANLANCASPSQVSTIVCSTLPCGDSLIMFTDRIINLAIPGDHIDTVGVRDITGIAPYTINTVSIDYAWSPLVGGNGPGPHLQKPTTTTIYNVTATFFRDRNSSRDFSGCPQLYGKMKITVLDPDFKPTFFIPNAFSPNDDINNNSLIPVVVGAIDYNLSIYDRWGGRVFEATDTNQHWNGKVGNSGADAPQGVYVYIAKLKSGKNVTTTYKGTITVTK